MAICSKYKIAYFLLATLQGFSGGKGYYSLEGSGSGPGLLSKLNCGWERFFFKLSFTSVWKQIKDFCLINSFLFFSLLWVFIPFLAAPIGWFNGTKGLSSITVQRKKHSLTGTGKAICNHNSSYLLIFYLKHSDVNSIVPCQQPWGKVHSETKTNFLRAGKSDGRRRDKLL